MANQPKKYKKFVATAATATLVASAIVPVASAASFKDVSDNNEFAQYIDALTEAGIINGYTESNTFKPNQALTRGQVVKMLGRWVESNGVEIPSDWKSKQRFNDVPTNHKDQELVKYAALVADEGVFGGAAGKLMAGNNITRQQMAKVLNGAYAAVNGQSLIEIAEGVDNVRIPDLASARAEFEDAIQALMDLEISSTNSGNFRPLENVTRAQFAKFLYNTINFEASDVAPFEIKAVNSTTVEVIFDKEIENIDKVKFAIEGLDVKEAVVKQTSKRTAVLTTAEQKGGTEYTVTVDGEKAGTFVGIAAVIPTAIDVNTKSVQGVIGEQVALTATVKVPEGQSKEGVSVTFNITNSSNNNEKIEVEAFTNAEGVATYKYTRYYGSEDTVTAYATKKSSVYSTGKVYWANAVQLKVDEITTGNALANNTKKSYKVTGKANATYYIAIKENLGINPDQITNVSVQDHATKGFVTPYELTTGATKFATVTTDAKGEGTFTIYGSTLSATPIVYAPETTPTTPATYTYNSLDLQAAAPTVTFSQINALVLDVKGEGTADSAAYTVTPAAYNGVSVGGRTYTATVTDKDGKVAPAGTVAYVTFESGNISSVATDSVYFTTGTNNFTKVAVDQVYPITVGKDGKAQFRVAGQGATSFAKPTVFLNTAGDVSPAKLDKADIQIAAETTYFKSAVVTNAVLSVKDSAGRVITSTTTGTDAYFEYQSVDQNGFAYRPNGYTLTPGTTTVVYKQVINADGTVYFVPETITSGAVIANEYVLAFDVTSTFGNAVVKDALGVVLPAYQNLGNTKTYHVKSDTNGKAVIRVTTQTADQVSVNVTGASNILPTATASVTFADSNLVPDLYSGVVESYNSAKGTLKFQGKQEVELYGSNIVYSKNKEVIATYAAFIDLLATAPGTVSVTREVKDGVTSYNIYNISSTGTKPVDTANVITPSQALANAIASAERITNDGYTTATWDAFQAALTTAKALPATATDAEKLAATNSLITAQTALAKPAPAATTVTKVTSAPDTTFMGSLLGDYVYTVNGTVANGDEANVKLELTLEDGSTKEVTVNITVAADKTFTATFTDNAYDFKVTKVKVAGSSDAAVTVQ